MKKLLMLKYLESIKRSFTVGRQLASPLMDPVSGYHLKKIVASCMSNWEYLFRMIWGCVDTQLPFISQVIFS